MKQFKENLIVGIDHGYGNIKTADHCFKTGIMGYDAEPLFTKDMLEYGGRRYRSDNIDSADVWRTVLQHRPCRPHIPARHGNLL